MKYFFLNVTNQSTKDINKRKLTSKGKKVIKNGAKT